MSDRGHSKQEGRSPLTVPRPRQSPCLARPLAIFRETESGAPAVALNIHHVLGSRLEPSFSERIHRLELHNAVDVVHLSAAALEQRELRATTQGGQELAIALPRHEKLF